MLGVQKGATADEIKSAYRKMAKQCHPDLHPGDKEAEARFKELNEANEVLSDPDKRARYDQFGFNDPSMGGFGGGGFDFGGMGGMGGMGDILDQLFNGGMGGASRRNGPVQGNDLQYELNITFEEAFRGCEKSFEFNRMENCEACKGSGAKPGSSQDTCPTCHGQGQVRSGGGWMQTIRTCPTCQGAGKVIKEKCSACAGAGRIRRRRTCPLKVPAGIDNGQTMRVSGQGEAGLRGGPNGDLFVTIRVRPHKLFRREGMNLMLDMPISFTQAALGDELEIPTMDGTTKYKIPEGTQTDTEFRIKGLGMPKLNQNTVHGDLLFRVRVEVPKRLTEKQRELLRQFDATTTGKEYEGKKSFLDKLKNRFN